MTRQTIALENAVARHPEKRLAHPVNFVMEAGEHIVIVGENGSGKSLLVDMLTGKSPLVSGSLTYDFGKDSNGENIPNRAYGNIIQLTFEDALGTVEKPYYFQQRFNSQDRDESPLVKTVLLRSLTGGGSGLTADEARAAGHGLTEDEAREAGSENYDIDVLLDDLLGTTNPRPSTLLDTFKMRGLLEKRMVLLSSGEMRRYQLFKNLVKRPRVLIVDNPFIGLDAPMRKQLGEFFQLLVDCGEVQIIMVQSMFDDIPSYMTHVVAIERNEDCQHVGFLGPKQTREEYLKKWNQSQKDQDPESLGNESNSFGYGSKTLSDAVNQILELPIQPIANLTKDGELTDEIIAVRDLSLTLPESNRVLYNGLNWTVRRGETWALQGANGSGKSTLLSLICADHPAAYACDISLFGRRRGTGESIWEIKKHIGFVSPEFHRAYKQNRPAIEIVASGLHDSVGLYKRPRPDQMDICHFWMRVFGIEELADRMFLTLSSGEQRLCLLARAFVKDPALLILDEPLHGLDTYRREHVRRVIDTFCKRPGKTLIMVTHYEEELPDGINNRLVL